eukprot:15484763-Alexandrium_andersonii.AAC.1
MTSWHEHLRGLRQGAEAGQSAAASSVAPWERAVTDAIVAAADKDVPGDTTAAFALPKKQGRGRLGRRVYLAEKRKSC